MIHKYYVTTSRGLVPQLEAELQELGAGSVRSETAGCRVRGPLAFGYRICMGSRLASRVLLPLQELVAGSADELYAAIRELPWEEHIEPEGSLAVDFTGQGQGITHTGFGSQRVKDGIVDRLRERFGVRPSVDRQRPDVRVNVHGRGRGYVVSIDLSGDSLHRRGYRSATGPAPIKETLAAGLVRFSGWSGEQTLFDPMCGSGTIAIEAAMIAADVAPGSRRDGFGFERWRGHDEVAWVEVQQEAAERAAAATPPDAPRIVGFDEDPQVVEAARDNARRAGVEAWVRFERSKLGRVPPNLEPGWVVTNPPYGTRMGTKEQSIEILESLGTVLRGPLSAWRSCLIVPDDHSMSAVGLAASRTQRVDNGPVEARFAVFDGSQSSAGEAAPTAASSVVNRMRKNLKKLRKWSRRNGVHCYRVYDADIPEYNAAVDLYEDHVHVQEYEAPRTIDPDVAAARLTAVTAAASEVLEVPSSRVHVKVRRQQKGSAQYERQGSDGAFFQVREGGHRFWVNLSDYLDTGLFLDHRPTRQLVQERAKGLRFLNLFCYTASFTVYAAAGGASSSVSVDLSNTYLDWARRNFELGDLDPKAHQVVRADCLRWLEQGKDTFDLVLLDPPTFSNSKAMDRTFDVQRDHVGLIEATMRRVAEGGTLIFSTNARKFRLDRKVTERFDVEDITKQTVPEDFSRGRPPHRCWLVRHRG